jgi:hypothetical protein
MTPDQASVARVAVGRAAWTPGGQDDPASLPSPTLTLPHAVGEGWRVGFEPVGEHLSSRPTAAVCHPNPRAQSATPIRVRQRASWRHATSPRSLQRQPVAGRRGDMALCSRDREVEALQTRLGELAPTRPCHTTDNELGERYLDRLRRPAMSAAMTQRQRLAPPKRSSASTKAGPARSRSHDRDGQVARSEPRNAARSRARTSASVIPRVGRVGQAVLLGEALGAAASDDRLPQPAPPGRLEPWVGRPGVTRGQEGLELAADRVVGPAARHARSVRATGRELDVPCTSSARGSPLSPWRRSGERRGNERSRTQGSTDLR